jgi:hypothetical protein
MSHNIGLGNIDPTAVGKQNFVEHINDLSRLNQRLAREIRLEHFGPFVGK